MSVSRSALRKRLRAQRRALSVDQRRHAAAGLFRIAAATAEFRNSDRIAFYLPNDGEQDVLPLLERAWRMKKRCYLPVLDRMNSARLWFLPYEPGDALVHNRYGIPEPRRAARYRVGAGALDLLLMPLVAFDDRGNRLGMGGGYYDRTLGYLRHRTTWRRPLCIGIAYEFQKSGRLDAADWDIPLDACVTESHLYRFTPRRRND